MSYITFNDKIFNDNNLTINELPVIQYMLQNDFYDSPNKRLIKKDENGREHLYHLFDYQDCLNKYKTLLGISSTKSIGRIVDNLKEKGVILKIISSRAYHSHVFVSLDTKIGNILKDDAKSRKKWAEGKRTTKETFLSHSKEDKNVSCKGDKKFSYQGDKNAVYLIDSLKDRTTTTNCLSQRPVVVSFLKNHFNSNFTGDFSLKLAELFVKDSDDFINSYLEYCYEKSNRHSIDNPKSYFYKITGNPNFYSDYKGLWHPKINVSRPKFSCPVCKTAVNQFEDCPKCGLSFLDFNNQEEIKYHSRLYALDETTRKNYEKAKEDILTNNEIKFSKKVAEQRNAMVKELDKKFGLI